MMQKVKLLSERDLDEIATDLKNEILHPNAAERLVSLARWAALAHAKLQPIAMECARRADGTGDSPVYAMIYRDLCALLAEIEP